MTDTLKPKNRNGEHFDRGLRQAEILLQVLREMRKAKKELKELEDKEPKFAIVKINGQVESN